MVAVHRIRNREGAQKVARARAGSRSRPELGRLSVASLEVESITVRGPNGELFAVLDPNAGPTGRAFVQDMKVNRLALTKPDGMELLTMGAGLEHNDEGAVLQMNWHDGKKQVEFLTRKEGASMVINDSLDAGLFWLEANDQKEGQHITPFLGLFVPGTEATSVGLNTLADGRGYVACLETGTFAGTEDRWAKRPRSTRSRRLPRNLHQGGRQGRRPRGEV